MTVQVVIDDIIPRTQLTATAGQTIFATNWTANVASDINVYSRIAGAPPNDAAQLVDPSLYNVAFIGAQRIVRVTFIFGRAMGDIVTIVRNTPADRLNLYINTNFVPSMLNQDFGILTLVDQQAQMYDTVVNPGYNVSATIAQKDKILPILGPLDSWRMNAEGTAIEAVQITGGSGPVVDATYWVSTDTPELPSSINLGLLPSGILKIDVSAGYATPTLAVPTDDYWAPGNVITLPGLPVNPEDAASKQYVDSIATGFTFINPVNVATTANLSSTYNNGSSGVGAQLTATANGAANIDGVALSLTNTVLFKNQTDPIQNGIYTVTQVGSVSTPAIFTRSTDYDQPADINPGDLVPVLAGTINQFSLWLQTATVAAIGTDPITFIQFGIAASNIVTLTGAQTITGIKTFNANVIIGNSSTFLLNGTTAVNATLDEDNMASNSPTALATQQSIKAYVDNAVAGIGGGLKNFSTITASGTWNRTSGATKAIVMILGGGGGGAGATGVTGSFIGLGSGGGAGETAWLEIDISAVSSASVTIGAGGAGGPVSAGSQPGSNGGTTSFGAFVTAGGGSGGGVMTTDNIFRFTPGGNGGTGGSGGDIQCPGFNGFEAIRNGASSGLSGAGASSSYGRGGAAIYTSGTPTNGNPGTGYGAGGGAAISTDSTQRAGGAGTGGLVMVWEY